MTEYSLDHEDVFSCLRGLFQDAHISQPLDTDMLTSKNPFFIQHTSHPYTWPPTDRTMLNTFVSQQLPPALASSLERDSTLEVVLRFLYVMCDGRTNIEVYVGPWTYMSLDEINARMKQKSGHAFCDIAYRYAGMGHIECLAIDKNMGHFFLHHQGGSNDWDRKHYTDIDAKYVSPDPPVTTDVPQENANGHMYTYFDLVSAEKWLTLEDAM